MIRRFARPYARAILEVCEVPQKAQQIHDELARFEATRAASTELSWLYANPGVDPSAKVNVTQEVASKMELSDLSQRILAVLVRNHRANDLGLILEALKEFINNALGVALAEVRSAHELTFAERDELGAALQKKLGRRIELRVTTDPALLGGFVAQIGSEVYDASVIGRIERLRESLK
jgi:ATP synthase, F1 delta subunit